MKNIQVEGFYEAVGEGPVIYVEASLIRRHWENGGGLLSRGLLGGMMQIFSQEQFELCSIDLQTEGMVRPKNTA